MTTKICPHCKEEKALQTEFYPKASWCRLCVLEAGKKWHANNQAKLKAYREKNKEKIKKQGQERWIAKKAHISQINKEWVKNNPEKMKEYGKAWRERDIEHARELGRKAALRRVSTVSGKLNNRMSTDIRHSLQKGTKKQVHWETLVDFTVDQLRVHLESHFVEGMSWDNYGKFGWHIDHEIPRSAFNITGPYCLDFKRCWCLQNLRPMWAFDNHSKKDKLSVPFQPSLAL